MEKEMVARKLIFSALAILFLISILTTFLHSIKAIEDTQNDEDSNIEDLENNSEYGLEMNTLETNLSSSINESSNISSNKIIISSPINQTLYYTRRIEIDAYLSDGRNADFYYMLEKEGAGRWMKICSNVRNCSRVINFNEGTNKIRLKASNGRSIYSESIEFKVDTKKPVIKEVKTNSIRSGFVNESTIFEIRYSEENLKKIIFYYGISEVYPIKVEKSSQNCSSGDNQVCYFWSNEISLSIYEDREISYWFEISDGERSVLSRKFKSKVDTKKPEIIDYDIHVIPGTDRVRIAMEIDERNFDSVVYFDPSDLKPVWRILCQRLKAGRCDLIRSFTQGEHNITIRVLDRAGNSKEINRINFII